jgi:hypothetical protein
VDAPNPTRWLAWELVKYVAVLGIAGIVILVLPGEPPRWLEVVIFVAAAVTITVVIYRFRASERRETGELEE